MKVLGHPLQGPKPDAVLQPVTTTGLLLQGGWNGPLHGAAQVQLFCALE